MVGVRKKRKKCQSGYLRRGLVAVVILSLAGSLLFREDASLATNSYSFDIRSSSASGLVVSNKAAACQRSCPFRRNKIVIDHFGLNGLGDRESIFRVMASMAGYLCATVYAPPPGTMLAVSHNGNQAISMKLMWRDFYSFVFRQDNSTALRQYQANLKSGVAWDRTPFNLSQISSFRQELSSDSWWQLSTRRPQDFVSHVAQLETFVTKQQQRERSLSPSTKTAFLWQVYTPHFHWIRNISAWFSQKDERSRMSVPKLAGELEFCDYIRKLPSMISVEIVDLVFDTIRANHPSTGNLGLFHIRRGDSKEACDTSLPRVHEYLRCSFLLDQSSEVESHHSLRHLTVLLASDERDECYRTAIRQLIEQGWGYGFVDLDYTIQTVLKEYARQHTNGNRLLNNMFIYHISKLVAVDSRIDFVLEQRRHIHCPNCTNVVAQLAQSTKIQPSQQGGQSKSLLPINRQDPSSSAWDLSKIIGDYELCQNKSKT